MATQTKRRTVKKRIKARPVMPPADANGYYPAAETLDAIIAQEIIDRRQKAGLSQAELAKRAGIRRATLDRVESGKHAPKVRTVEKIDRALVSVGV